MQLRYIPSTDPAYTMHTPVVELQRRIQECSRLTFGLPSTNISQKVRKVIDFFRDVFDKCLTVRQLDLLVALVM